MGEKTIDLSVSNRVTKLNGLLQGKSSVFDPTYVVPQPNISLLNDR